MITLSSRYSSTFVKKFEPAIRFSQIDTSSFDIVHFHGDDYLCGRRNRHVRTFYGSALSEAVHAKKLFRRLYQSLFYSFEWVSCIRTGVKVGISRATGAVLPLVRTIIPCGVPLETYLPAACKTPHPSILFLGDLDSRKQGDFLLNQFTRNILPELPHCSLTIIGPQQCSGEQIRYLGTVSEDELVRQYQKAWVYCMPSSYEGFGVPAIEALACGCPVVALKNPGINEIIVNKRTGILVERDQLTDGILQVLSDAVQRRDLEKNGRELVERKYDIRHVARMYNDVYCSLVSGTRSV